MVLTTLFVAWAQTQFGTGDVAKAAENFQKEAYGSVMVSMSKLEIKKRAPSAGP